MKKINLKTALSKYHNGHNIRVIATMRLISKPVPNKPRTVLLTDIKIDGKEIIDHIWVAYNSQWSNYSHEDRHKVFTFKTKVTSTTRGPMTKYVFGAVTELQLLKDYVPKKKREAPKPTLINPDTAQLIPLLSAKRRTKFKIVATAIEIVDDKELKLEDIVLTDYPDVRLKKLSVPITPGKLGALRSPLPTKIECDLYVAEDLHKILPYQPVKATSLKNLTTYKEI